MTLFPDRTFLSVPIRHDDGSREENFGGPRSGPLLDLDVDTPRTYEWHVREDRGAGRFSVEILEHEGAAAIPNQGVWLSGEGSELYEFELDNIRSVAAQLSWTHEMRRDGWHIRTVTETTVTATDKAFVVQARLRAWEGDNCVHEQTWNETIPRQLV